MREIKRGEIPMPDEWLRYAVEKLQEEGRRICCDCIRIFK